MSGDERRRLERVPHEVKVDYRTAHGTFMTDYSKNISARGIYVATSLPLPKGERVRIRLTLDGRDLPYALEGVVRWSRTAADDPDSPGMGVEFVDYEEVAAELADYVSRLASGAS